MPDEIPSALEATAPDQTPATALETAAPTPTPAPAPILPLPASAESVAKLQARVEFLERHLFGPNFLPE